MQPRSVRSALLALGLVGLAGCDAQAQDLAFFSDGLGDTVADAPGLTVFSADTARPNQGMALAGWMLYPSFYAGGIYNDNVYATRADRVGIAGVQLNPALEVFRDNGLFKTDASFGALITVYPGAGPETSNFGLTTVHNAPPTNFTGHALVTETWKPLSDWSVVASGNVYRSNGLFGTIGNGTQPGVTIASTNVASLGSFSARQQYINSFGSHLAVDKTIDERTSIRATVYYQGVAYDNTQSVTSLASPSNLTNVGNSQDGLSYGAILRGSFYVTPRIYVYAEPNLYFRRYDAYTQNSNGYTTHAGVGSRLFGLFAGEIYGGYQEQWSVYGKFGSISVPSYGFRVLYFPTPLLTITLNAYTNLTTSDPTGLGLVLPTTVFNAVQSAAATGVTKQATMKVDYGLNAYTTVTARGGYGETKTSQLNLTQQVWFAGANISYNFWRNTSVVMNYSFVQTGGSQSRVQAALAGQPPLGFQQNVFSAGFQYSY